MWSLEYPAVLLLLSVLPVLIYFIDFKTGGGGNLIFAFDTWKGHRSDNDRTPKTLFILSRVFFWLGFMVLILAAAGPTRIIKNKIYLTMGADIMVVLDESPSMSAEDFAPKNRFEAAKSVIKKFIKERKNDKIGLVGFSKEASLIVPPTLNYSYLLRAIDNMRIMELGNGTAIGMGISIALVHLKETASENKFIILLTDGDNNAGEILPVSAAEIARQLGVKIYTVGIGKEGETFLQFKDPSTGKSFQGVYKGKFDEAVLKRIAAVTDGKYFYAGDVEMLNFIFNRIDSSEKVKSITRIKVEKEPVETPFILIALTLVLFDFIFRKTVLKEVLR